MNQRFQNLATWTKNWFKKTSEPAHLKTGKWGEQQAVIFLKKRHYKIIGQRVRVGKRDELDIIAQQQNTLVFVEVKTRRNENYGRPFSAVNKAKRQHLSRAAIAYLKRTKKEPNYLRFDVIEIIGEPTQKNPEIRHIENAFPLDSRYKLWW